MSATRVVAPDVAWDPDDRDDDSAAGWPASISLAPLRADLRRRRWLVVVLAVLGGLTGLALSVLLGSGSTASTTVFLARDNRNDPLSAMQTDLSLLSTRVVAEQVISEQRLDMTPHDFLATVSVTNPSTQLVEISVAAEDPTSAVARAESLAVAYLEFRSELLTQQAEAANDGRREQAAQLGDQLADVTAGIREVAGSSDPQDQRELEELIGQRGDISGQIARLREDIQAQNVELAAVVSSSRVVDPAGAEPESGARFVALSAASGVIGGALLAVAIILAQGVLTQRPRLRSTIATDLGAPVVVSVRAVRGKRWAAREARATAAARVLDVLGPDRLYGDEPLRVAVLSVSSASDTLSVASALVKELLLRGRQVSVIDLTESGRLGWMFGTGTVTPRQWAESGPPRDAATPVVVRPTHVPAVAGRPPSLDWEWERASDDQARPGVQGVTVVVGEATPTVGAEHIATWAEHAFVVVRAGAASHDRLASTAGVIRAAGLVLLGAVLTGSDRRDDTLGLPEPATTSGPAFWAGGR